MGKPGFHRALVEHYTFVRLYENRDWLAQNHSARITLEAAAANAGFSPFHYQRMFVRAFGETPHQFVTRLRIESAQRILRSTADPVSEICLELGYESFGTFSTLFARKVGCPPSEFRRIFSVPDLWSLQSVPSCFQVLRP